MTEPLAKILRTNKFAIEIWKKGPQLISAQRNFSSKKTLVTVTVDPAPTIAVTRTVTGIDQKWQEGRMTLRTFTLADPEVYEKFHNFVNKGV